MIIGGAAMDIKHNLVCLDDPSQGIVLTRLFDGQITRTFSVPATIGRKARNVAFLDDCCAVASGSDHGAVYIFDCGSGEVSDILYIGQEQDWVQSISTIDLNGVPTIAAGKSGDSVECADIYIWTCAKERKHIFNIFFYGAKNVLSVFGLIFIFEKLSASYLTLRPEAIENFLPYPLPNPPLSASTIHTRSISKSIAADFSQLPYPNKLPTPYIKMSATTTSHPRSSKIPVLPGSSVARRNSQSSQHSNPGPTPGKSRSRSPENDDGSSDTPRNAVQQDMHASLFGDSPATGDTLMQEMLAASKNPSRQKWKGKTYGRNVLRDDNIVDNSNNDLVDTELKDEHPSVQDDAEQGPDAEYPEDTPHHEESRPLDAMSSISRRMESTVDRFHRNLRRRFVLQYMRDSDLVNHSTTYVPNQHVYSTPDERYIYAEENPEIRQLHRPIEDAEIENLRKEFPEPFSKDDPSNRNISNRRAGPAVSNIRGRGTITYRRPRRQHGNDNTHQSHRNDYPRENPKDNSPSDNNNGESSNGGNNRHCNQHDDKQPKRREDSNRNHKTPDYGPPDSDPSSSDEGPTDSESSTEDNEPKSKTNSNKNQTAQPKPTVFGETRYSSADRTFSAQEEFTYDPTPKSEEEVLRAAFRTFEDLIVFHLYGKPNKGNGNIQKTIIQSIPKPEFYHGENDFVIFDAWIRGIVRWLNVADQCGPEFRWSKSKGTNVLTSVDIQRTNTIAAFLRGAARQWFTDVVERIPDEFDRNNPLAGRMTFMQVVSGLYRRFIHEASLTMVAEKFDSVYYSQPKGIKGVFSSLTRYAKCMPSPPDSYTFKKRLFLLVPESMANDMTRIHKVTAESSTVNEIMQAALACERSSDADKYYQKAREALKRARRRRSRSRSRNRKKNRERNQRSPSPRRLQKVNGRRYSVKPHSKPKNDKPDWSKRKDYTPKNNNNKSESKDFKQSDRKDFTKQADNNRRLYRMVESEGKNGTRLFRMVETDNEATESNPENEVESYQQDSDKSDQDVWSKYDSDHSQSETDQTDHNSESEPEPWGGSQWTSDAADDDYMEHIGFMHEISDSESTANHIHFMNEISSESDYDTAPELQSVLTSSEDNSDMSELESDNESIAVSESVLNLDFGEYLRTMNVSKNGEIVPTLEPQSKKSPRTGTRPRRTNAQNRCLAAFVEFNGIEAFALFDSGSTADAISPDFARNAHLRIYQLENPVTLQLGTKGSRSKINYGCTAPYQFRSDREVVVSKDYFDIANIDRYDVVLGTVFMRKHGLSLHFEDDTVRLNGRPIPTLLEGEEVRELTRRYAKHISNDIQIKDGEEIEVRKRPKKYGVDNKPLKVEHSKNKSAEMKEKQPPKSKEKVNK
ncbi:hypothetical protein VKT23_015310 [Stygiomarasmius scandens]|uniref:Uncharacterized protein n=1 Tax=Marasmiellus scandens TaxID=2682957 RepID=A0ABR1IY05_9AGAR